MRFLSDFFQFFENMRPIIAEIRTSDDEIHDPGIQFPLYDSDPVSEHRVAQC